LVGKSFDSLKNIDQHLGFTNCNRQAAIANYNTGNAMTN